MVVRYNTFDASQFTTGTGLGFVILNNHGNQGYYPNGSVKRASPIFEMYNNTISTYFSNDLMGIRGGSVLIHDNVITGGAGGSIIMSQLTEEEAWQTLMFNPLRTAWPAQDQIFNSFYWNNTINGSAAFPQLSTDDNIATFIQQDRDYFLHSPQSSGGYEYFTGSRKGGSQTFPTATDTGSMAFSSSGSNAYYPYIPYTYPHPLDANGYSTSTMASAPSISSFTASPTSIASGSSSTLSWITSGANTVSIDHGVGNQSATSTGSVSVSPSTTTIYTLTAVNSIGTTTATTTVTVTAPVPLANVYIAQTSQGSNNGSSCANAYAVTFFNTAGNWGSSTGQIGPGTTVHLCGTFTAAANQIVLTFNGSGTAGNPITLKWESGAKITTPACPGGWNLGCVYTGLNSYLVIDGNGTSPSITAANNGSAAGGYAYQAQSVGIYARGCNNCEIKNLVISDMYMMTDPNDSNAGSAAVLISESSNTSVHGNSFDQTGTGISDAFANGDTNLSLYNNTFDHFNHGIEIGQNNANVISNVYIYANHLKNMNTWDSTGNWYHHDGIFFYQNTADSNTVRNFYVYNNLADGDMGNNVTAWIYFNSGLNGIYVFNNILLNPYPRSSYSQFLLEAGYAGDQNVYIENDYFDCGGGPAVRIGSINGITFQNNAMDHCGMFFYGDSGNVVGTIDHNVYGGGTPSNDSYFKWNSAYISFNAWKASGLDTHSVMPAGAGANSSGQPQSGSAMIHDGANNFANLTSSCTGNLTPLCTDYAGIIRPSSGTDNWDAGAYQYQATPLANVYIAQTAQGSNNGTSCANAYAVTFFNTAGNWGSGTGQIGPVRRYICAGPFQWLTAVPV